MQAVLLARHRPHLVTPLSVAHPWVARFALVTAALPARTTAVAARRFAALAAALALASRRRSRRRSGPHVGGPRQLCHFLSVLDPRGHDRGLDWIRLRVPRDGLFGRRIGAVVADGQAEFGAFQPWALTFRVARSNASAPAC